MFKKNDPLVEVSKKIMQENETRRQVESLVNESLGIESRKAIPHEYHADYDDLFKESIDVALKEGIEALDEMLGKGEKNLKSLENYYSIQNDRISNIRDRKEDKRAARQISKDRTGYWSDADKKSTAQYEKGRIKRDRKYAASLSKRSKKLASKLGLREEEQLDEVTIKAIVKKVANELPSRKKKIEDLNRRAMQKPTVKGWANAQKRVNAAVNEEQLDEEFKHVKVAKKGDVEKAYRLDRGDRRIDIRKHKDGSWVADSNFGHTESDGNDYHSSEKDVKRVSTPARRAIKSVMKGARDQRDAIKDELDESVRTPLPKVYKKKAIKEDTSIEAINEEIYDNLLANLIEAYQSSEDAFNDMVDSLTEEQLQILGFTEGIQ